MPSRPGMYGLILLAGAWWNFWPVLAVQAALTVWVLHLVLRAHGFGRPWMLFGVVVVLCALTTLPWLSAILLTDILCGLGVLALYLVMVRPDGLGRAERFGLFALIAVAGATHNATYALLLALLACAVVWHTQAGSPITLKRLRDGAIALALGAVVTFAGNFAISGTLAWTPGGAALSFGRMLQDGIVTRYLNDRCPNPRFRLCDYRNELPLDADMFFWGNPIFIKLGRFAGLGKEMQTIAIESLTAYPLLQLKSAVLDTGKQIVEVRSGEGVLNEVWHTYAIIERYTPWATPQMKAAHQQRGDISFTAINTLHYPLALLAILALPALLIVLRQRRFAAVRDMALTMVLAVLANAAICGVFSNPHDRYGARIVWLASLTVLLAALTALRPGTMNDR